MIQIVTFEAEEMLLPQLKVRGKPRKWLFFRGFMRLWAVKFQPERKRCNGSQSESCLYR
jgi:hypothetical protein